jgi:hypothetical protein
MKICAGCGTSNKDENIFCIGCSKKIEETVLFCIHCGNKIVSTNKFCKFCGNETGKSVPAFSQGNVGISQSNTDVSQSNSVISQGNAAVLQGATGISQGNAPQTDGYTKNQTPGITQTYENNQAYNRAQMPPKKKQPYKKLIIALSIILPVFFISLTLALVFAISELPSTKQFEIKAEMGADQERMINLFGYPDQFLIMFDEGNNNNRMDLWTYSEMETIFIFEDGAYDSTEEYYANVILEDRQKVFPDNFIYAMTPDEVKTLISKESEENIDEITGLKVLTFGNGAIICIFNPDDELIIVSKQLKLSEDI